MLHRHGHYRVGSSPRAKAVAGERRVLSCTRRSPASMASPAQPLALPSLGLRISSTTTPTRHYIHHLQFLLLPTLTRWQRCPFALPPTRRRRCQSVVVSGYLPVDVALEPRADSVMYPLRHNLLDRWTSLRQATNHIVLKRQYSRPSVMR